MLTEQDIQDIIFRNISDGGQAGTHVDYETAAQQIHAQHLAECERIAELAFNAGKTSGRVEEDGRNHGAYFETYQDYKDSLKTS